jgi:hypothetical protein
MLTVSQTALTFNGNILELALTFNGNILKLALTFNGNILKLALTFNGNILKLVLNCHVNEKQNRKTVSNYILLNKLYTDLFVK